MKTPILFSLLSLLLAGVFESPAQVTGTRFSLYGRTNAIGSNDLFLIDVALGGTNFRTRTAPYSVLRDQILGIPTNGIGTNSTFIAYRTDGLPGAGSAVDPLNGSTSTNLMRIFSNAPAGQTILFYPSTNYTFQPKVAALTYSWTPKSGQSFIGLGGMNAVKITYDTNMAESCLWSNKVTMFVGSVENFLIQGIHLDCNINYFNRYVTNLTKEFAAGHLSDLGGDNIEIRECRVTGHFGGWSNNVNNGSECFPIFIGGSAPLFTSNTPALSRKYIANRIINNEVIHTNANSAPYSYGGQIANFTYYGAGENADLAYKSNKHWMGWAIIDGNRIISTTNASIAGFASGARTIIRNNTVENGMLYYIDTWMAGDVVIENNQLNGNPPSTTGPPIDFFIGGLDSSRFNTYFDIVIKDNIMNRSLTPTATGSGTEGFIRGQSGTNADGSYYGMTNVVIEGNRFMGPTNGNVAGITIGGRNVTIRNNTFSHLSYGVSPADLSKNWVIEGNAFTGGGLGVQFGGPAERSDFIIQNNFFAELIYEAIVGVTDNLVVKNNYVKNYSLSRVMAVPFCFDTNYLSTFTRMATNLWVSDNIFWREPTVLHTNADYTVYIGGVNGFTEFNNVGNAVQGVAIGACINFTHNVSNQHGITIGNALYVTNSQGAAKIYTNGVEFAGGGGGADGNSGITGATNLSSPFSLFTSTNASGVMQFLGLTTSPNITMASNSTTLTIGLSNSITGTGTSSFSNVVSDTFLSRTGAVSNLTYGIASGGTNIVNAIEIGFLATNNDFVLIGTNATTGVTNFKPVSAQTAADNLTGVTLSGIDITNSTFSTGSTNGFTNRFTGTNGVLFITNSVSNAVSFRIDSAPNSTTNSFEVWGHGAAATNWLSISNQGVVNIRSNLDIGTPSAAGITIIGYPSSAILEFKRKNVTPATLNISDQGDNQRGIQFTYDGVVSWSLSNTMNGIGVNSRGGKLASMVQFGPRYASGTVRVDSNLVVSSSLMVSNLVQLTGNSVSNVFAPLTNLYSYLGATNVGTTNFPKLFMGDSNTLTITAVTNAGAAVNAAGVALPATAAGFLTIYINGEAVKIPYYTP